MSDKKKPAADDAQAAADEADIAFDFDALKEAADKADEALEATLEAASEAADAAAMEAAALEEADPMADAAAEEIAALTAERDELRDKLMRALAEGENVRRRAERDRKDAEAYGGAKLARDLLSVHDNMERALAATDDAAKAAASSLIEGVELTQRELLSAFGKHKIEKVEPAAGEKFDPNLHQAMFEAPVPGAEPGTVIEVMQAGFTISGRLLRPALVGVAKAG
ncbi:MAG: nucleotide exchange factor GrpE [Pseudomonadota bacterium]